MSSKRARELLTSEQRLEFASIPEQISEYELGSYYTLSPHDIEIIKRHRRDHNKLGFALQLCVLRFPGWTLSDVQHIPDCVVNYIAKQLQINAKEIYIYAEHEQTKHEHLEEIRREYGFQNFTITAGYTDQVFGLAHLLGFRFTPRLRDLADSKLYTIGKSSDFPQLEKLLRGQININIIQKNYDDVLRLAHSIQKGTVSASLIMGKLGSYARQNSLATALREMGRIEKTIFILDYISSETLRRKIHRGLNKGEAMNALARSIFFGKRGELRERALQDQLQRASALNIIINAISIWNTVYLTKAIEYKKENGVLQEELLHHISPLGWGHINFLGEYKFNFKQSTTLESLRPLRK